MLKTERMTRTLVVGTMDALHDTVDFLYKSRNFHVINYKKDDVYDIGNPLPEADEASRKLLKMMSISSNLDLDESEVDTKDTLHINKIKSEIDGHEVVEQIRRELDTIVDIGNGAFELTKDSITLTFISDRTWYYYWSPIVVM